MGMMAVLLTGSMILLFKYFQMALRKELLEKHVQALDYSIRPALEARLQSVERYVLSRESEEVHSLLQPVLDSVQKKEHASETERCEFAAQAFCVMLDAPVRAALFKRYQTVLKVADLVHGNYNSTIFQKKWGLVHQWFQMVLSVKFPCPCECGEHGTVDHLSNHISHAAIPSTWWSWKSAESPRTPASSVSFSEDDNSDDSAAGDNPPVEEMAAVLIQASWRGSKTRTKYPNLKRPSPGLEGGGRCELCHSKLGIKSKRRKYRCRMCQRKFCSKCTADRPPKFRFSPYCICRTCHKTETQAAAQLIQSLNATPPQHMPLPSTAVLVPAPMAPPAPRLSPNPASPVLEKKSGFFNKKKGQAVRQRANAKIDQPVDLRHSM
eukprot:NODE_372_length_1790_cov_63.171740_g273_i0.p1 GENE.NODE_372_length_1790_cov_63.171740_g273_i0~~NODE_372_length_1790_cov_63.171740_g273_i0.p1  ORF type:complete len:380 (-),score=65.31 NODE_372_length_1790_cov_63.171740_g273_i0:624-1763(-)